LIDWKTTEGPWAFKKSFADNRYNEGTHISSAYNSSWVMPKGKTPVTDNHTPCGYWLKDYTTPEIFTSDLYPLDVEDSLDSSQASILEGVLWMQPKDQGYVDSSGPSIVAGNLVKDFFLVEYKEWPVESIDSSGPTITSGLLAEDFILVEYEDWPWEGVNSLGASIESGVLDDRLIKYTEWPEEKITSSGATILGGVLE